MSGYINTEDYVVVHVGITTKDPESCPTTALLERIAPQTQHCGMVLYADGDGFTAWGEPWPEDSPVEPVHVAVYIPRDHGREHDVYAALARAAVSDCLVPLGYRLVDYVAVDYDRAWGEDSRIVGRWA